jgi:hypothetical protein
MRRLFIFFIFFPLTAICQNTENTEIKTTKNLSVGFTFSPDYSYRILEPSGSSEFISKFRDTIEIPKFGYTTGLNFAWNINKRITLETGLLFSNKGEKTKKHSPTWITSSPEPDPALPSTISLVHNYIYLDIPIKANYYLLRQRVRLYLTGGVSTNLFITEVTKEVNEFNDGSTSTYRSWGNNGFSRINLAFIVGAGFEYELTNKSYLKIEPIYRRSITSVIDAPIKGFLYSSGLNIGLFCNL